MKTPPASPADDDRAGSGKNEIPQIHIHGDFNYTPNDIAELKKLADAHPELAKQIAADRLKMHLSDQRTARFGMMFAVVLGVVVVVGACLTLVKLGWWQSLMFVVLLLALSHVLRTIIKGEWSDTSWLANVIGIAPKSKNTDDDDAQ